MMMSFCRKTVHSFLGLTPSKPPEPLPNGLRLITSGADDRPRNVVESSCVSAKPFSPEKKDPGGIGFIDDIAGGVDGLMSCTESLGFESSEERLVTDMCEVELEAAGNYGGGRRVKERRERAVARKFPPPLSSLNQHGQPKFYLRPVRKDGRLELYEVRIERPEILKASREDGRLRLHLIRCKPEEAIEEKEATSEEAMNEVVREREEKKGNYKGGNGEGFRRCIEAMKQQQQQHHNHHLDVWRRQQYCVTTT